MNKPYYITFGSAAHFPYKFNQYIVSYGKDEMEASEIFRNHYPDVHEDTYNFAFIYSEEEWKRDVCDYYKNQTPQEILNGSSVVQI